MKRFGELLEELMIYTEAAIMFEDYMKPEGRKAIVERILGIAELLHDLAYEGEVEKAWKKRMEVKND